MRNMALALALAGACVAQPALGQRRTATVEDAVSYVYSAFITRADPGVMARRVVVGPELQKNFSLPAEAAGPEVYQALLGALGERAIDVRKARPEDVVAYGKRRGFDPAAPHPLYTVEAGELRFLVHYDLHALSIPFVGQLGVPDPDPKPVAVKVPEPEPKKAERVRLAWAGHFPFGTAELTAELRARLDAELFPELATLAHVDAIRVSGHADRMGTLDYNQRLSEERAAALRDYLVEKGIDPKKIEVFGYGTSMPVKSCEEEKTRAALIDCLAANRRAAVEVQGAR